MVRGLLPLVLVLLLAAPVGARPGPGQSQGDPPGRSEHVKNGAAHFDRAFYQLTPHKQDLEASREFDLAIAEFEAELRAQPSSAEAHRYLARIFTLRKQFRQAGGHYDALSDLDLSDVDACVLAAVAWADAGEFAEARERLLKAKARTTDPEALTRLDGYLAKLDGRRPVPLP